MASTLFTLGTTTYPTHHHHHRRRRRIATAKQPTMPSFPSTAFTSVAKPGRVYATTTTAKSSGGGGGGEEKSILDWILSGLQKEDQLLETDPILKKVEEKGSAGSRGKTAEAKKDGGGGFGGLFAKK